MRLALLFLTGCATLRPITAAVDDEQDYRKLRTASSWGARLASAQAYVEKHPSGAWVAEVNEIFENEEPKFWDQQSSTRAGTSNYVAWLPKGPHANAAVSLLVAFDAKVEDFETFKLLKSARSTEKALAEAAEERRATDEWLSGAVAALVDDAPWGKAIDEAPPLLSVLKSGRSSTWGGVPTVRDMRFGYGVPFPDGLQRRIMDAKLALVVEGGLVRSGKLEGPDLMVHWAEIDALKPLDPARTEDRAFAATRMRERLTGMLEKRFPEKTCSGGGEDADLLARTCGGRRVRVIMGGAAGEIDRLDFVPSP